MKTFAEAFAARGLDDWDVAQAIKKLTAQHKRRPARRSEPFYCPNAADMAAWQKSGLTGAALAVAYVKAYETTNGLRHTAPTFCSVPATPEPVSQAETAPQQQQARRPARARRAPAPCSKNPLDALLCAVHDAHLMQRETRRAARRIPA